jgi:hypothetical protein
MPTERMKGSATNVSCLSEELLKMSGLFRLEHDVNTDTKLLTRTYRLILDGKPSRHTVRFKYDYRTGFGGVYATLDSLEGLQGALESINRGKKC